MRIVVHNHLSSTSFINHSFSSRFYVMLFIWSLLDTSLYVQDNCLNHTPVFDSLWCTLWFSVSSCLLCTFSCFFLFLFVHDLSELWMRRKWRNENYFIFPERILNFLFCKFIKIFWRYGLLLKDWVCFEACFSRGLFISDVFICELNILMQSVSDFISEIQYGRHLRWIHISSFHGSFFSIN